jgi:hypothetical protein
LQKTNTNHIKVAVIKKHPTSFRLYFLARMRLSISVLFLLLVSLYACEFPITEENFVKRTPPADFVHIEITLFEEGDTILVTEPTDIQYNLNLYGKKFYGGIIKLHDQEWNMVASSGSFHINPAYLPFGFNTISMEFYFSSGTNSIADGLGAEGYTATMVWVIFIENRPPPEVEINSYINNDGYLTIFWSHCDQYNFEYYRVGRKIDFQPEEFFVFDEIDKTEFVDSCYFGKSVQYSVLTKVKGHPISWSIPKLSVEHEFPEIIIEDHSIDSIRLSWNKIPFPVKYTVSKYGQLESVIYFKNLTDTSVVIPKTTVGVLCYYQLLIEPFRASKCASTSALVSGSYRYGSFLGLSGDACYYNHVDNVLYNRLNSNLRAINFDNKQVINEIGIDGFTGYAETNTSFWNTKVVAKARENIYVFDNKDLVNPQRIHTGYPWIGDYLNFTNNNHLAFLHDKIYKLYDLTNGNLVAQLDINDLYTHWGSHMKYCVISSSANGNLVAWLRKNGGINIAQRNDNSFLIVYEQTDGWFNSVFMNPLQSDQVFVSYGSVVELIKIPEYSIIKTLKISDRGFIRNMDPHTGYILVTTEGKFYIIDSETLQIVLSMKSADHSIRLMNNTLFFGNGYYWDISPYLTKNHENDVL